MIIVLINLFGGPCQGGLFLTAYRSNSFTGSYKRGRISHSVYGILWPGPVTYTCVCIYIYIYKHIWEVFRTCLVDVWAGWDDFWTHLGGFEAILAMLLDRFGELFGRQQPYWKTMQNQYEPIQHIKQYFFSSGYYHGDKSLLYLWYPIKVPG